MREIDTIAERYVEQYSELDPIGATSMGIAGFDHLMTDLSPAGFAARAALDETTLAQVRAATPADDRERVAQTAMVERLTVADDLYKAGAVTSDLNVIASWLQATRQVFDLMPVDSERRETWPPGWPRYRRPIPDCARPTSRPPPMDG
jgi:hypothetical protein